MSSSSPELVTRTRPPLSADWRLRRAFTAPLWAYGLLMRHLGPDPRTRARPVWPNDPEITVSGPEAFAYAERWISLVSESGLPFSFAMVQTVGAHRLVERVAVAWMLREGLGLDQSVRELLPVIGSDWPEELQARELVNGAAVVLWSRVRAVKTGAERRAIVDTFRSWAGFQEAMASAWAEWEAYVYPNGRRVVVVEGGES